MRHLASKYITLAFFCKNVTLRHGVILKTDKSNRSEIDVQNAA